ncbi:TonB-dependent receptor [Aliiglaciecola sp. CAU 1673]|uniref:TonB-dependent receptor n=1 Tax=Aliiglaciecola sp. CAU 1673 TaxID=3032595 RepID=UPI0023DA657D|nr:TonB-dependent receptor [Aliiglaciecola sp. CAU 1673]MDF2178497.1 TonB-dependent receptor [Aliiglaciecola sp. CAU 1673]
MNTRQCALALAIASALGSAQAQEATSNSSEDAKDYEQIVVTGTPSGTAMRKVDASFAITNLSADAIRKLAPKSTADLFKAVPGVWAESSGGVSGANVFVRGFPSTGDAPFLTVQMEGAPLFQPPTLSFLENSTLFRIDETVAFMEALRGGTNPVVSNGQPGLTTNFMLKEGSEVTEGLFKYSTSDYDLQRVDAVVSGKIDDGLYYMVGGYVSSSPGIRDAGFNAEKGHQFTVNITKELDNGKMNFYTRVTDDHGVWYLPTPLIDGVDNSYTQIGTMNRQASIQYGPDGTTQAYDFGDGRGWDGSVSGGKIQLDLGNDWEFVDRFNYTKGDANTFGLVPNGEPVALSTVADNGSSAVGAVSGNAYSGSTQVQQIGRWVVLKEIESFTNDLAFSKRFDALKLTVGLYNSHFSANDWWSLGNQSYHVVAPGGENLTGIDCNDNLDSCGWNYDINSTGDGRTQALYTAFEYKPMDNLTLDLGLRRENHEIEYTVDEGLDGVVTKSVDYDEDTTSWTAGVNYMLTDNSGVFFRINDGNKMPYFDDFRDNYGNFSNGGDLIFEVDQYELGYKLAGDNYSLYATGFFNESESSNVTQPGAPAVLFVTETKGVEIDANYTFDMGLNINLNATLQDTEITKSDNPDWLGNEVQRQPGWQIRVTPSYDVELAGGNFLTLYGTVSSADDRWSDNGNAVVLEGYTKVDVGAYWEVSENVNLRVSVDNLTDKDGLTEGDPRNPLAPNGRFILPRSVKLSVGYTF